MIDKPRWRAEFLSINHIEVLIILAVHLDHVIVVSIVIKSEQIGLICFICVLAGVGFLCCYDLSEVDIDKLALNNSIGGAEAYNSECVKKRIIREL